MQFIGVFKHENTVLRGVYRIVIQGKVTCNYDANK
jgi:hypothetical protein